jgi:NAD(P)-dependent dehydrogenase (short-subunit alcohol dehydrogenase family)
VTKSAQIHLVKCLAVIASPEIRVNSVSPGMLLTVRTTSGYAESGSFLTALQEWGLSFSQEKRDATIRSTKLGRLATVGVSRSLSRYSWHTETRFSPQDVAQQVCCFVQSPSVTGANEILDAGSTL